MSQYTLDWDNTDVLLSNNIIGQRAMYRRKSLNGEYISDGFDPSNDLSREATESISPDLPDNNVYQFKVVTICVVGGLIDNDNGIKEMLSFSSIRPNTTSFINSASTSIDINGTDITKVRYTLKKSSDNSVILPSTDADIVDGIASITKTDLIPDTDYYWQTEFLTNFGGQEVSSASPAFAGNNYGPFAFRTLPEPICNPIISFTIKARETNG